MDNNAPTITCSFCKRKVVARTQYDVPIYDPRSGFSLCANCIRDIYHLIEDHQEDENIRQHEETEQAINDELARIKPHLVKDYLDQYIINQDHAKKVLSVAIYNHFKRMKYGFQHPEEDDDIDKSNVIILGPSGCGKTALLSHLAKMLDIPFAVTDASSLTETCKVCLDSKELLRKNS